MRRNTKHLLPKIFVFTLIAAAYSCRMFAKFDIGGVYMNYIRAALYLLLFALWVFHSTAVLFRSRRCTACV